MEILMLTLFMLILGFLFGVAEATKVMKDAIEKAETLEELKNRYI